MLIDPLFGFVFFGLFSPGPNVILITASGARFGFRASIPHLLGVVVGVGITSGLTGYGIGTALSSMPRLELALKIASALWILYMAWGLWRSSANGKAATDRPMRFHEAILFQWVNPKVWAVALAAASGYPSGESPLYEAFRLATAFSGINFGVLLFWTSAGALLTFLLTSAQAWMIFTRSMALALAAFSIMIFL